ncbi:hypothetical protein ACLHDD_04215 [Pantoea sp. NSTU24]|uniref:hypothetical protein n=1 Tax=Pantoea sp. NSTU24 TaxID=3391144 RepID=UPI003D021A28
MRLQMVDMGYQPACYAAGWLKPVRHAVVLMGSWHRVLPAVAVAHPYLAAVAEAPLSLAEVARRQ